MLLYCIYSLFCFKMVCAKTSPVYGVGAGISINKCIFFHIVNRQNYNLMNSRVRVASNNEQISTHFPYVTNLHFHCMRLYTCTRTRRHARKHARAHASTQRKYPHRRERARARTQYIYIYIYTVDSRYLELSGDRAKKFGIAGVRDSEFA